MHLEAGQLHARVFDHVHVVEPDVLQTSAEVAARLHQLARVKERVHAPEVNLKVRAGRGEGRSGSGWRSERAGVKVGAGRVEGRSGSG